MASVKLDNKSARILMVGLGGGESLTVPPTDPTTGVGGITVKFTDDEKERFDKAIATPAVQEWIEAEELVISDGPADPEPKDKPSRGQAQPERKAKHGFFGGGAEKDHKGEP